MKTERNIVCGGANAPAGVVNSSDVLKLDLWERNLGHKVTLKIGDMNSRLGANPPAAFHDLLEIATYVLTADAATSRGDVTRGGCDVDTFGEKWRRTFCFHVPVRVPDLWNTPQVKQMLTDTLGFLSDDFFDFTFYPVKNAPPFQLYLELDGGDSGQGNIDQVMMFSGGLDSLSGGVEETIIQKHRALWVSHRPTPKHNRRHREIHDLMARRAGALKPSHVLVDIFKDSTLTEEYTQRTRSFLFAALGATAARTIGLDHLRFFENGVVSLNLPVAEQLIGSRATRTTHPRVLKGFQSLMSLLAGKPFKVENPFLWETKGEIVERIVKQGCGPMITSSVSCAHTWDRSRTHPHCGVCSQCIDRRFAVIASGAEEFDPQENYELDIFTKSRRKDADKIMGAAYLERAKEFEGMTDWAELLERYPEVTDILPHLDMPVAKGAARILDLHRRHAAEVKRAALKMLERAVSGMWNQHLDDDCLLRTMYESRGLPSPPKAVEGTVEDETDRRHTRRRLGWLTSFDTVWLDEKPHDLRKYQRARACLQYLVDNEAFDKDSARHLVDEIEVYVREQFGESKPLHSTVKIQDYFKASAPLLELCREIVTATGEGEYFLKVE